jgi:hypothetical protein
VPNGWIILDKPVGLGSTQAVAAVKRNLRQAGLGKVKVGHGGTLDPLASGVLPIALGEATKLAGGCSMRARPMPSPSVSGPRPIRWTLKASHRRKRPRPLAEHRGGAAALHRPDRAGAAGLFGAEGRWRAGL